jgi:putative tRNA adenosine deaminase-associated protein
MAGMTPVGPSWPALPGESEVVLRVPGPVRRFLRRGCGGVGRMSRCGGRHGYCVAEGPGKAVTLPTVSTASKTTTEGFGVAVTREESTWKCSMLAPELLDDLDGVITGLRRVATSGPVFGMLAVDDEFFVIVRPIPGGATLLLSDATAALDYDIAADVLDLLQVQIPEDEEIDDDPWPEGDLTLLADLGVPEQEMQLIVDDDDLYPDEQLARIAQRCGFGDAFAAMLEKV